MSPVLVSSASTRRGTVLIIVAGVAALLAMLALAFLARMRADAEEANFLVDETRARMMFASALQYIAETARIGWDDPATPEKEEAFGWVDIRTGNPGPRDRFNRPLFTADDPITGVGTIWPAVGSHMICNAALWTTPPTAISQRVATNPIPRTPGVAWSALVGYPNLDPAPVKNTFPEFLAGNDAPVLGAEAPCWFRMYRKTAGVFIVTCGGGTSGGYRDWAEVQASPDAGRWYSRAEWELARTGQPLMWYEVAWSPAVNATSPGWLYHDRQSIKPAFLSRPFRAITQPSDEDMEDQVNKRNQFGTFLYRQRLEHEPTDW